jgi:hypothetical protein
VSRPKPKAEKMQRFNDALRGVLRVSKGDLSRMLEQERRSKIGKVKPGPKPKRKTSTSGHAGSGKG